MKGSRNRHIGRPDVDTNDIPEGDDEGKYTKEFRRSIKRGRTDLKAGRVYTLEEVKKTLGIKSGGRGQKTCKKIKTTRKESLHGQ